MSCELDFGSGLWPHGGRGKKVGYNRSAHDLEVSRCEDLLEPSMDVDNLRFG